MKAFSKMDSSSPVIYVTLGLQFMLLLERLIYWLAIWGLGISKSSCITTICKGCITAEAEVERDTRHELNQIVEGVNKELHIQE
jgi:hypothetical protein